MKTGTEMVREAGLNVVDDDYFLERLVELARADAIADEREACAKVCDAINAVYNKPKDSAERVASQWCAERIRARGNT